MISDVVDDLRPLVAKVNGSRGRLLQPPLLDDEIPHNEISYKEKQNYHFDAGAMSLEKLNVNMRDKASETPPLRRKSAAKTAQTRVTVGMRLKRWIITGRIGAGSFGETFTAIEDTEIDEDNVYEGMPEDNITLPHMPFTFPTRQEVCIKVEQENKNVLRVEAAALKKMQPCPQVVRYLGSGSTRGMNFVVMQKLGPNLTELRRNTPLGTFSAFTTLKIGISCLKAIRGVHELGLVHRDIKPSNVVIGVGGDSDPRTCYLIDFGLARRYRRLNGELRPPRENAGFRGTSRYASLASHRQQELGRVDDIWSLLFMLIEIATGTLPWRKFKEKEEIGRCKEEVIGSGLVQNLPREFRPFLAHLQTLRYEDEPSYDFLLELMEQAIVRRGYPPDKRLDWEPQEESEDCDNFQNQANNADSLTGCNNIADGNNGNDGVKHELPSRLVPEGYVPLQSVNNEMCYPPDAMNFGLSYPLDATRLIPSLIRSEGNEGKQSPISINDVCISPIFSKANLIENDIQDWVSMTPHSPKVSSAAILQEDDYLFFGSGRVRAKAEDRFLIHGQKEHFPSDWSERVDGSGENFSIREGGSFVNNGLHKVEVVPQLLPDSNNMAVQRQKQLNEVGKATTKKVSFASNVKVVKKEGWNSRKKPSGVKKIMNVCNCSTM